MKLQGSHAGKTGKAQEQIMRSWVEQAGYAEIDIKSYDAARCWLIKGFDIIDWCKKNYAGKKVFLLRQQTVTSIYKIPWRIDLTIWDETLWKYGLFIEAKNQSASGSVDEKLPFVVASLKNLGGHGGLLLQGEGFRHAAKEWALAQQTDKFRIWTNPAKMTAYIENGKTPKERDKKTVIVDKQIALL